jgi:hypothetical protein
MPSNVLALKDILFAECRTIGFCKQKLLDHRVHRVATQSVSGVHSIMRVKLAQAGEGEGCKPTPFPYIVKLQCTLRLSGLIQ